MSVEDELVLPADQVAECEGGIGLARALGDHPLPLDALAAVVRRRRRVDDQARARARASTEAGGPGYQMSSQMVSPTRTPPMLDDRGIVSRLEVAPLVEDAVVGQEELAVHATNPAVCEHGGRVVGGGIVLGKADDRDQPVHG